jgi:hypothetical protein
LPIQQSAEPDHAEEDADLQPVNSKKTEKPCSADTLPLAVLTSNFFAPVRTFSMEMESTSNSEDPIAPQDSIKKSERPPL